MLCQHFGIITQTPIHPHNAVPDFESSILYCNGHAVAGARTTEGEEVAAWLEDSVA